MSVFSLVQAFQCLTSNKNLSGYNFFMCVYFRRLVLEKENFLFALSLTLKSFPLILSLLKSHIQIFLFRNIMPLCSSRKGCGLAVESSKQQLFSCMLLSMCVEKSFLLPQEKVAVCYFLPFKLVNR